VTASTLHQLPGPSAAAQRRKLRHLEHIAGLQQSATTAGLPARDGLAGAAAALWAARRRLLNFAACGTFTFLVCLVLQITLIRLLGVGHVAAYIIQAAFGVQFNFMLSRLLTWRDRSVLLPRALMRYSMHQLAAYGLGMALYAGLDWLAMNYIVATIAVNLTLTPVSFAFGNRWSMAERHA
jgi:putative flippase GtrA